MLPDVLSRLGNVCCPISESHLPQSYLNTITGQRFDARKIMIYMSIYLHQHITEYYFQHFFHVCSELRWV